MTNTLKPTGIIRRIDSLGRVLIPKEIRRAQGWQEDAPLEIYSVGDGVLLKKYAPLGESDINTLIRKTETLMEQMPEGSTLQNELLGYIRVLCNVRNTLERDAGGTQ